MGANLSATLLPYAERRTFTSALFWRGVGPARGTIILDRHSVEGLVRVGI